MEKPGVVSRRKWIGIKWFGYGLFGVAVGRADHASVKHGGEHVMRVALPLLALYLIFLSALQMFASKGTDPLEFRERMRSPISSCLLLAMAALILAVDCSIFVAVAMLALSGLVVVSAWALIRTVAPR